MMIERIEAFLNNHTICVLATVRDNIPHCSLMAYMVDEHSRVVYMVTPRNTNKYQNILKNPHVSLLVDDRCQGHYPGQRAEHALTVHGTCRRVEDEATKQLVRDRLAETRPDMRDFIYDAQSEVIAIDIVSFLFLHGVTDAHLIEL
jgi:nitroimidazol reductase NimA-like FMN-containing flavoprotein (pyridoxamine 5'-phosphate oxidase superfamily)